MAKPNKLAAVLPRMMRLNYLDIALFNWVLAFKRMFPNEKEDTVIKLFMKEYGLCEDDFSLESSKVQLNRMWKYYYDYQKECS